MSWLKHNIYISFSFVRYLPGVCLSTSPLIHFKSMTHLLQVRCAAAARLQPPGFIFGIQHTTEER